MARHSGDFIASEPHIWSQNHRKVLHVPTVPGGNCQMVFSCPSSNTVIEAILTTIQRFSPEHWSRADPFSLQYEPSPGFDLLPSTPTATANNIAPTSSFVGHERPGLFWGAEVETSPPLAGVIGRPHPMQLGAVSEISLPQSGHLTSGNVPSRYDGRVVRSHSSYLPRPAYEVTHAEGADRLGQGCQSAAGVFTGRAASLGDAVCGDQSRCLLRSKWLSRLCGLG